MAGGPVVTKGAARIAEPTKKNGKRAGGPVVTKAGVKVQESGTPGKKTKRPTNNKSSKRSKR